MAAEAPLAEVGRLLFRSRKRVWIMTGNAPHFFRTAAGAEATARVHLLDRADKLPPLAGLGRLDEVGEKELQRQPRPVIQMATATAKDPFFSLQMTLLANRLAQSMFQTCWIDNGII